MRRQSWRIIWLGVHRTLALSLGFVFVLMGLTGSCNVFYIEIEEWLHPELSLIIPTESSVQSFDKILKTIQIAHPNQMGSWHLELPHHSEQVLTAWHYEPQGKEKEFFAALMVSVNPYTAEVLWSRFWGDTLMTWLYDLHWTLFLGELGHHLVGILGLILLFSLCTGLYLWWPAWGKIKQAFIIKREASDSRLRYDRHRVAGIYSLAFLSIVGMSGFYLVYPEYVNPINNIFPLDSQKSQEYRSAPTLTRQPISLTNAVNIAQKKFPHGELRWLITPENNTGVYEIQLRQPGEVNRTYPATHVWIDQYSGKILSTRNPHLFSLGEKYLDIQYPLHNGELFGLPGRAFIFCIGFVPLLLFSTGMRMWWKRAVRHHR